MDNSIEPVMKRALGAGWERLAPVVRRHYELSTAGVTNASIRGVMDEVHHNLPEWLVLGHGRILPRLQFDRAAPGLHTDTPTGVYPQPIYVLRRQARHRFRLDAVQDAGTAGH